MLLHIKNFHVDIYSIMNIKGGISMRFLTDVSKTEFHYPANQSTAKDILHKIESEGRMIPNEDNDPFVAVRKAQETSLRISDEGREAYREHEQENRETEKLALVVFD